jgi:MFS family permease
MEDALFQWYAEIGRVERRTFWACLGGWALDALDVQIFSLVIPALIATFHLSRTDVGLIGGVTLVFSALGGWLGGALADRIGRVRALQATVLWFAVSTFLAAFAQSSEQLLVTKALQGLGFGGEWAVGAVLMAETIRAEHRGKALGAVQGGWAIGWGAAVLLYTATFSLLPQETAWRTLFALGLLPALLILYIRRAVPEPTRAPAAGARPGFAQALLGIFAPGTLRATLVGGLFGLGAHGGFYALFTWLPTFLKTERGLSVMGTGGYLAVLLLPETRGKALDADAPASVALAARA